MIKPKQQINPEAQNCYNLLFQAASGGMSELKPVLLITIVEIRTLYERLFKSYSPGYTTVLQVFKKQYGLYLHIYCITVVINLVIQQYGLYLQISDASRMSPFR